MEKEETFRVPYGKDFLRLRIESREREIFHPSFLPPIPRIEETLLETLNNPRGVSPLKNLLKGRKEICIVVDDNTRPPTARLTLPVLLPYLRNAGVKKVTLLIALGLHKPLSEDKKRELLGPIPSWVEVVNHSPEDTEEAGEINGIKIKINRIFLKSPFRMVIGDVEFHQIFGYGGGAKSLLPGIADTESITYIHSLLVHPDARPGNIENNPVQKFLKKLYSLVRVDFSLQYVLNTEEKPIKLFGGTLEDTFFQGIKWVDSLYKLKIERSLDTLVVSPGGFPRDIDLYQTQKVLTMTGEAVKKGGKIFIFSECSDGPGPEEFVKWMNRGMKKEEIEQKVKERFSMGLHKLYLFLRGIQNKEVYLYSSLSPEMVKKVFLKPVKLEEISSLIKKGERVGFVPYGTITLLERV